MKIRFIFLFAVIFQHAAADELSALSTLEMTDTAGQVLVMYVNPQQPESMLAGTAHGGLWRSTDSGNGWKLVDSALQKLPVSAIAVEPDHPEIMYAGTGNGRKGGQDASGRGLFRSSDGGLSWMPLPLTDPQRVGEKWNHVLSVTVSTAGVVLAATSDNRRNGYIFRSTDNGQSWGLFPVYDGSKVGKHNLVHKVRFDPDDPNVAIFMDDYANVTYSSDAGVSWSMVRKSSGTCK